MAYCKILEPRSRALLDDGTRSESKRPVTVIVSEVASPRSTSPVAESVVVVKPLSNAARADPRRWARVILLMSSELLSSIARVSASATAVRAVRALISIWNVIVSVADPTERIPSPPASVKVLPSVID